MCEFIPPSCVVFCLNQHRRSCVLMLRRWYPRHLPIFIYRRRRRRRRLQWNGNKGTSNVKSGMKIVFKHLLDGSSHGQKVQGSREEVDLSVLSSLSWWRTCCKENVPLALADCRICLGSWSTSKEEDVSVVFDCKTIQGLWQGSVLQIEYEFSHFSSPCLSPFPMDVWISIENCLTYKYDTGYCCPLIPLHPEPPSPIYSCHLIHIYISDCPPPVNRP